MVRLSGGHPLSSIVARRQFLVKPGTLFRVTELGRVGLAVGCTTATQEQAGSRDTRGV